MVESETATIGRELPAGPAAASGAFLQRLRVETRAVHATVEDRLALAERLYDVHGYVRLLRILYPLYVSIELRLGSFRAWSSLDPPIDIAARRRAQLVLADLRALGVDADPRGGMRDSVAPDIGRFARAIGALYVLEGSRLGGCVLARQVVANVGASTAGAVSFLRSEGSDVGDLWKEFCSALGDWSTHAGAHDRDAAIAGALETFRCFDRQLARWRP